MPTAHIHVMMFHAASGGIRLGPQSQNLIRRRRVVCLADQRGEGDAGEIGDGVLEPGMTERRRASDERARQHRHIEDLHGSIQPARSRSAAVGTAAPAAVAHRRPRRPPPRSLHPKRILHRVLPIQARRRQPAARRCRLLAFPIKHARRDRVAPGSQDRMNGRTRLNGGQQCRLNSLRRQRIDGDTGFADPNEVGSDRILAKARGGVTHADRADHFAACEVLEQFRARDDIPIEFPAAVGAKAGNAGGIEKDRGRIGTVGKRASPKPFVAAGLDSRLGERSIPERPWCRQSHGARCAVARCTCDGACRARRPETCS